MPTVLGGFRGRGDQRGHGGGGGDRGFRGGYSGGQSRGGPRIPPTFVKVQVPQLSEKDLRTINMGWKDFSFVTKEDVKLQVYKGPPAKDFAKKINLSVNHFSLENFKFPSKIYHYEVTIERIKTGKKSDSKDENKESASALQQPFGRGKGRGRGKGKQSPPKPDQPVGSSAAAALPPRKLPKPLPQLILTVLLNKIKQNHNFYGICSDLSNNIYSTKRLEDFVSLEHTVDMKDLDQVVLQETDSGSMKITILPTDLQIDTTAMSEYFINNQTWKGMEMDIATKTTVEQVYNAIVKSMPNFRFLPLGRSNLIRWPENKGDFLGLNVVNWKGISANISMGWKPYLNVDIANSAFLEDKMVLEALEEQLNTSLQSAPWPRWAVDEARAALRNVKAYYNLPKGKKLGGPITDILETSVENTFFDRENGTKISVFQYFLSQYDMELNPKGACLVLKKDTKVPAELCIIKKGQSFNKKLNDEQTRNMLGIAKKDPGSLQSEIKSSIQGMNLAANNVMKEWGINIAKEMLTLKDTRVLEAPKLRYGDGTKENEGKGSAVITPNDGQWEIWNSNFKFFQSKDIKKWGILVAGDCRLYKDKIENFRDLLVSNGASKGVNFLDRFPKIFEETRNLREVRQGDAQGAKKNVDTLKKIFDSQFPATEYTLVVVVIPKKNSTIYSHVKQAAELHSGTGMLTQCVVGQNVFKGQAATVQNILLKINSKLGGVNHVIVTPPDKKAIDMLQCPMLIVGADVTHPPPGSKKIVRGKEVPVPSFAAVTGSVDRTGMPFMMDIRAQTKAGKGAAEVIQNLDGIITKMLRKFEIVTRSSFAPNGIRPRKIIYFRDGVGEGQFQEVLHTEMNAIRKACSALQDYNGECYKPKITFVTVQKRHKTRFFYHPSPGQTLNAPAGTVVDTEIVHQTETDFYLCSHKGMMGTSRPTRYHVLWDDSDWTADQIQTLTYYLCYMYVRCNKSVKIPAPTYYAHWAAARAKSLTDGLDEHFDDLHRLNDMMRRHGALSNFPMHFV